MAAIDISVEAANLYFGESNHVRAPAWAALSPVQMASSLAHAARVISREISEDVSATEIDADTYYRPDFAVFEQALAMMLRTGAIPNAERTGPHYLAVGDEGSEQARQEDVSDPYALCMEAAGYLQRPRRSLRIVRG